MVVEALVTPFLRVPLFMGLPPNHLARIASCAERIVYRPGDVIIHGGGAGDAAVLVVSGEAARIDGPSDHDGEEPVPPNALIGEMAMLIETEHTSTVIAKSTVRALLIPRSALAEVMEQDTRIAEHFIGKLTARLQDVADQLRSVDTMLTPTDGDASEPLRLTYAAAQASAATIN
jgi:CRP/FNR family cyclic AMP-dependent transcriptional regulator